MKETIAYLNSLFKDNDTLVIGLSGGPDSMCLINILLNLEKKLNIICAHINHNVRKESFNEAKMVERFCKEKNLTFETTTFPKKSSNQNYNEQELREMRYEYFEKIIYKYQAKYLLTAHHGDDLIETILMRITRGSNLKGYSGFQTETIKKDYKIIKPLIYMTKEEINNYNKMNNIKYCLDSTNFTEEHTRNRYRKEVIPFLKKENRNVHLKYLKFSKELNKYYIYVDNLIEKEISKRLIKNTLDIKSYNSLDPLFQTKIIEKVLDRIYIDNLYLVSDKHVNMILDIIHSPRPNIEINLPNGIRIAKNYGVLKIKKFKQKNEDYCIRLNKNTMLPNGHTIEMVENATSNSNNYLKLNSKNISLPLYIRTRKTGDKMVVKNMKSPKKIKDIFIDAKIPKEERDSQPLVIDNKGEVLWIPGIKKSKFDESNKENCDIILWYN